MDMGIHDFCEVDFFTEKSQRDFIGTLGKKVL